MGIDHLVQLDCEVRRSLAGSDLGLGSQRIMEAQKAASKAAFMRSIAAKEGIPLAELKVRSVKLLPTGPVEADITVADMEADAAVLKPHASKCRSCPANRLGAAFGCYDSIQYPIAASTEEWLMDRVQAPDTVGGTFLHRALADFGYDGAPIRSYRQRKLMEAPSPPTRTWKTGWFSQKSVNADQLWHAMLAVGPLQPSHAFMVLLWLGAVEIGGRVPKTLPNDAPLVQAAMGAAPAERARTTKLAVGAREPGPIGGLQGFLAAMHSAWVNDADLVVDA